MNVATTDVIETRIMQELHPLEHYGVDDNLGWTTPIPPKEIDLTDTVRDHEGLRFFFLRNSDPIVVRAYLGERFILRTTVKDRAVMLEWIRTTPATPPASNREL
jgi:hypothetical protein